ncbi:MULTISPECIES: hypothetical protein [unclassified Enterococcus]|uniref:hypothetical protein n=1 Tax=unclassified Enterococcus TaxID=2608891 RepID=UPI00190687E0|nr:MULTISPECIES: hypothetical protein [unclassified Enterococcus]MBK0036061.1 hypothetical protein [Enterococcus sp. S52]MBK0068719.1 hypothetical protein [Enterococcus sp. S53]MBK0139312.1 hypothetical protein [Enterococcus sp. S76]MBK0142947.1 hypothetical protein [Enterococcus sp. S77]
MKETDGYSKKRHEIKQLFDQKQLLTTKEVAEYLHVRPNAVLIHIQKRHLTPVYTKKLSENRTFRLFSRKDIELFADYVQTKTHFQGYADYHTLIKEKNKDRNYIRDLLDTYVWSQHECIEYTGLSQIVFNRHVKKNRLPYLVRFNEFNSLRLFFSLDVKKFRIEYGQFRSFLDKK